ncbi:MAG TPA: TrmJ/YjtD family RNA methyltransferase [Methanobacterium sp.]|nr:TrmJ/YjtD family RNA methyltransferase [Methanobacterium sp.]
MIYVVFVEPESPGNIGFLARSMKNFGLNHLVLINPCSLENEAWFQAMHAREIIRERKTYPSLKDFSRDEGVDFLIGTTGVAGGSYNVSRIALKPEQLRDSVNLDGKIAIIFGREGNGLTNKEIEMCDVVVSVPTHESYPIMNITHAAAIIFYELFKKDLEFNVVDGELASHIEKDSLISSMNQIIDKLGYPPHKNKTARKVFHRILGRSFITAREAHTLKGMLRRIEQRMNNNKE